jgi:guanyl-specific ribonuclease Sa
MGRLKPLLWLVLLVGAALFWNHRAPSSSSTLAPERTATTVAAPASTLPAFLPAEAREALDRIARGGPFEHNQDGGVFGNYEGLLPQQPRGYYHEYTVETPGARNRGARRIITGGTPPVIWYYTDDHYRSFRRFEVDR